MGGGLFWVTETEMPRPAVKLSRPSLSVSVPRCESPETETDTKKEAYPFPVKKEPDIRQETRTQQPPVKKKNSGRHYRGVWHVFNELSENHGVVYLISTVELVFTLWS